MYLADYTKQIVRDQLRQMQRKLQIHNRPNEIYKLYKYMTT
jgi:hypothetical protein